ncbi:receptor-type tyrosine-protein phosphatase eta-like [Pyxicephalus adspersus]|uniref:receptor-type tyrosine-protein phosphatase eta-like n=1 Tax=Pyxicephalus adspersus TaxID=30357 RepID=UPI003B5BA9A8
MRDAGGSEPEIVKNLQTENITTPSISLSWEKPDGNASSYFIQILEVPSFNWTSITTSKIIEGLTPGNYYTFLVSAVVNNISGNSSVIACYTVPGEVKNLTTKDINTTSISLSWDIPGGNVSHYLIEMYGPEVLDFTVYTNSAVIGDLSPGNHYLFLVYVIVDGNTARGNSSDVSAYTFPSIVTNLTAEIISTTYVSLSWEPPVGNTSSFMIQVLHNSSYNRNVTSTSAIIDHLTPGNYYTFLVSAVVDDLVKGNDVNLSLYTKPEIVNNLQTENITTTSISLSWEKPDGNASSYFMQILGDPSFNTTSNSTTSDIIERLTPGNYYTFLVSALVNNIRGKNSVITNFTVPEQVTNLTAENITTNSISLSWEKPDGNASSYFIQILGDPSFNRTVTSTSYVISNLIPGNYYMLLVSAVVGENNVTGEAETTYTYTGES